MIFLLYIYVKIDKFGFVYYIHTMCVFASFFYLNSSILVFQVVAHLHVRLTLED